MEVDQREIQSCFWWSVGYLTAVPKLSVIDVGRIDSSNIDSATASTGVQRHKSWCSNVYAWGSSTGRVRTAV